MGDTPKKKMETEKKTEKKKGDESGAVNFAELRDDLFREAAKLVSEDPNSRIAIFVTPPPSESDNSVCSFAHPSVDGVLQNFLEDNRRDPVPKDAEKEEDDDDDEEEEQDPSPKRFWWENLNYESMNQEQLQAAAEEILKMKKELEAFEKSRASGNHKDLLHNDDKDTPKP